ncbi:MAG: DUF2075 domain-containing protein [Rectinema sp.]|nr:DUF2075 domain-containing protein [Rectinema sp.]
MDTVLRTSSIPKDCGILIEFNLPNTSKRIDFIIAGMDHANNNNYIVIELKQWQDAKATEFKDIVVTFVGHNERQVIHPSYQAYSYNMFLLDMNVAVHEKKVHGYACAYLHNYQKKPSEPLLAPQYLDIVNKAPVFFKHDAKKLQDYIYHKVGLGKGQNIISLIEDSKIIPSKELINCVNSLLKGNDEFILLDEQKVAFEAALGICKSASAKTVIIIQGGPGTGKSVIALNLLGKLLELKKNVRFVAPNAAFRNVMIETLSESNTQNKIRIKNLFMGSSTFCNCRENEFDILIVDEAHRLKDKRAYQYKGDNQIDDIISSSRISIFFIDDRQKIRPEDIGSIDEIKKIAGKFKADLFEYQLDAQFRCAGAKDFIAWIENILQIDSKHVPAKWDSSAFDFRIYEDPNRLYEAIKEKASKGYKARLVAGYAWYWTKTNNDLAQEKDVRIPEFNFSMPWNQRIRSELWAVNPNGLDQIGCVHTIQGLEFDYIGVIIGNDLIYNKANNRIEAVWEEYKDYAGKKGLKNDRATLNNLIKNIYRILLSRGMRGCYVFCRNRALRDYFIEQWSLIAEN